MFGLAIESGAISCSVHKEDLNRPDLTTFDLNMHTGTMALTFSEVVDGNTFTPTHLFLQNHEVAVGSTLRHQIKTTIDCSTALCIPSRIQSFTLTTEDLNNIKVKFGLAVSKATTWLTVGEDTVQDMNSKKVNAIGDQAAEQVTLWERDGAKPTLDSASIDMDTRTLTLEFSETVDASELTIAEFILVNDQNGIESVTLSNYDSISADGPSIDVVLTVADMNKVKANVGLFTESATSYIQTLGTAAPFKDMTGNEALQIATAAAVGPLGWSEDTTDPALESWSVSIDKKKLWLTFDETVFARNFDETEITFHGASNGQGQSLRLTIDSSVAADHSHGTVVEVDIGSDDMNNIKAREALLVNVGTSYLEMGRDAVLDMEGLQVEAETAGAPAPVSANGYEGDMTAPVFTGYELNMDFTKPLLTLSFDETVRLSSKQPAQIVFVGTNGEEFPLGTLDMIGINANVIQGEISVADSNLIKKLRNLATSTASTNNLKLGVGAFSDMETTVVANGHPNAETTLAIANTGYTVDGIAPTLTSYTLNMATKLLSMTFAETVEPAIVPAKFLLVDSVGTAVALGASSTSSTIGTVIDIAIDDLNADDVKLDTDISANEANTFLSIEAGAISDAAGNPIEAVDSQVVAVGGFQHDDQVPNLSTVTVNLDRSVNGALYNGQGGDVNDATITFNFDEPVDAIGGFDATAVTLVSTDDPNVVNPPSYTLSEAGTWTLSNGRQITLTLSTTDLNAVKALPGLFADTGTSFLTIGTGLVNDMAGNPVASKTAHAVGSFDDDSTAPVITAFTVNMAASTLTMTFQETVSESTLVLGSLRLQQQYECVESAGCDKGVTLTGGAKGNYGDKTELTVILSDADLNEMKRKSICLKSSETNKCWLSVADFAVQDMNQQPLTSATNGEHGKECSTLIEDNIPPALDEFVFDIDGLLTITFTETVDFSTVELDQLVIQSAACAQSVAGNCASTGNNFRLTKVTGVRAGSSVVGTSNKVLQIQLGLDDKNGIKQIEGLATDQADTFISFSALFAKDMTGISIAAVEGFAGEQADDYTSDLVAPTLAFFTIDMSGTVAQLALTFSETVDASTLKPEKLVLQSTVDGQGGQSFQLNGGTVSSADSTVVTVDLIHTDRTSLEALLQLVISDATTYLSFIDVASDADVVVRDMQGNAIDPISSGVATLTSDYIGDETPPSLVSFTLDLTTEYLTMSFSETIDIATLKLDGTGFTLLNTPLCDAADGVTLDTSLIESVPISGSTLSADGPEAVVKLTLDTLNAIKSKTGLATLGNGGDTYLAVYPGAVRDTVFPVKNVFASHVTCTTPKKTINFEGDDTPPTLNTGFSLNMLTGKMVLYFSETVDFATFTVTELKLTDGAGIDYRLTSSSQTVSASVGGKVIVQISEDDLNRIKMTDTIGKTQSTTYVYFTADLVDDMNGNPVESTVGSAVGTFETVLHPGAHYVDDTAKPSVEHIDLDLTLGTMSLFFDEAVRLTSLNMAQLQVIGGTEASSPAETMSTATEFASYITNDEGTIIEVALTQSDLDKLKLKPLLAVSTLTTIFAVSETLVVDYQGNVMELRAPFAARAHVADETKPTLVSFSIDMHDEELAVTFSEAVASLTLDVTGITIQDSQQAFVSSGASTPDYAHRLQGGQVTSGNGYIQVIKMNAFDLNHLKRLSRVATATDDSFIRIDAGAVQDLNGKDVVGISDGGAVQANNWETDTRDPTLTSYNVVMAASGPPLKLYLKFSETVDVTNFDVTKVVLQDTADSDDRTTFHRLSGYEEINVVPLPDTLVE